MIKLTVLGCHSPFPGPGGATPGYLLEVQGKAFLLDCGSGVVPQLANYRKPYELDGVFLSHLHHDHITDFFILQYALLVASQSGERTQPLSVYAPPIPEDWYKKLSYGKLLDRKSIQEAVRVILTEDCYVEFFQTDHAIPCYAMKISCQDKVVLYGADSGMKTDWSKMGNCADLLILEATYLHKQLPPKPTGHLSAQQAGEIAERIGAKRLLLTHYYPYNNLEELQQEAQQMYSGTCKVAQIGDQITL